MDAKVLRDRNLIASINSDARTTRAGLEPSHTGGPRGTRSLPRHDGQNPRGKSFRHKSYFLMEVPMARARYFVVLHEGQWKISHEGQHHGPYAAQEEAIRVAVDAAHKAGNQ